MARISTYAIDGTPVSSDKLIGTDSAGTVTKNYPLGDVADWLKSSGATGILGQNNYTFQIAIDPNEGRKLGAFSFGNYGGDGTAFSAVTTLRFSAYSSAGQNVAEYINTTVGGRVILGQLDDLNSFGVYVLTSFIQNQSEPTFYDASLVFVKGNGNLRGEKTYGLATYSDVSSSGGINTLKIGTSNEEGLTDVLKSVFDGADKETKLRLSTNKFEVSGTSITRSGTNPVVRLVADNADNPSFGETMGTLRFTRNFEDPLALDLARAIYADFSERVTNDGGTVEGSEECVARELELIVSGEYLINMVDIKPEYTGALASTKADLVISINNGSGVPIEKVRITKNGDIEVKDPSKGIILRSENNTAYRIVVGNAGTLAAIPPDSFKPAITTLPAILGTLNAGETLTANAGNVSGEPTPTQVLQWQRSDDGLTGWADIAGATGTTYLLAFDDEDKYIRVQQTEENILGTATSNSASTTQIQPALFVGLLDEYPNASTAYSLRKLRTLYTGSAIRVTTNGADGADIGFLANNELDIPSLEAFANGNDVYITTWYDQSGNGNHAVQTTFSLMPLIAINGNTYLINSKPAIKGNMPSYLILTNELNIEGDYFISTTLQYEVNRMVLGSYTDSQNFLYRTDSDYRVRGSGQTTTFPNSRLELSTQYNSNVLRYGATMNHSVNGGTDAKTGSLASIKINALMNGYIGDSYSMEGYVQEVIIWESNKQSSLNGISANINDFYSIY